MRDCWEKARALDIANVVTFGADEESQCRLMGYSPQEIGSRVEAVIQGTPISYRLGTVGRHWAMASLAVLAAASAAHADLADAASALAYFHEPEGRGRLSRIEAGGGFVSLIDDCYNASPSSTTAAIAKLAEIKTMQGGKGRAVAVLGDMLELGAGSPALHAQLLEPLQHHRIDKVYLAGPLMRHLFAQLPPALKGAHVSVAADLAPLLAAELKADDVVLIKGSRGSRMDIVRDALAGYGSSTTGSPVKAPIHVV